MDLTGWRDRLAAALEASGKSKREVSLASGSGPGYLHSILKEGKDPSVENLARICGALGVSLTKVLYGIDISPATERLMRAAEASEATRNHLLAILEAKDSDQVG